MADSPEHLEFTAEQIESLLNDVNDCLEEKKVKGEVCIFGGETMLLAWESRESTRDVDAVLKPSGILKNVARQVAKNNSLGKVIPGDWLNDGVKGFIDREPAREEQKVLFDFSHLQVMRPPAEYLLAMKAQSARVGEEESDVDDLKFLMEKTGIDSPERVLDIVEKYYPNRALPPKVELFVKSVAEEV